MKKTNLMMVKHVAEDFLNIDILDMPINSNYGIHPFEDEITIFNNVGAECFGGCSAMDYLLDEIEYAESVIKVFSMVTEKYRLWFLKEISPYIGQEDFERCMKLSSRAIQNMHSNPFTRTIKGLSEFMEQILTLPVVAAAAA